MQHLEGSGTLVLYIGRTVNCHHQGAKDYPILFGVLIMRVDSCWLSILHFHIVLFLAL